jgi:hypothetical protein
MIITNAIWEKHNIGLKTCEITFSATDNIDDYIQSKVEKDFEYIVAKAPAGRLSLIHDLENRGFRYLENQLQIAVNPQEINRIDKKWNRVLNGMNCKKITSEDDFKLLFDNINKGMFDSDRVTLDPLLGRKASASRYSNWLNDLRTEKETEIYFLMKNKKKIGFFIFKNNPKKSIHCVLAGLFDNYKGRGNALAIIYLYLKLASEKGVKTLISAISTNNKGIMNLLTNLISFKVQGIYIVLRKMNNLQN